MFLCQSRRHVAVETPPRHKLSSASSGQISRCLTGSERTFTFLGGGLLPLLRATSSPLHPLPAAEHVVVLIRGHLLRILVLREDACEETRDGTR